MLAVLLGLSGALVYGAADFMGGLASRRISAIRVTALGGLSGLVLLVIAFPVIGGEWSTEAVWLGALSGVSGAAAIALLYACLAIGPMSILSPLTALVSAIVPLGAGLIRGEGFSVVGYLAIGLALVAVVLVGFVPGEKAVLPSARALVMAVAAGALIGVFLIVIDLTPADSGLVPLLANRATNAMILFTAIVVIAVIGRSRNRVGAASGWRPGLTLAIAGGAVDATANVLLLLALRAGELSVVSVLTALYPAGTIILAAIVLKERIAASQAVGLVLAIAAAGMLSLA